MKSCAILAGGPEPGLPCMSVPADAYLICADSGLHLAKLLRRKPDFLIGDFDSIRMRPKDVPYFRAPAEKDDTDTMLAVRYALEKGFRDIRIYGAFGGRLDHTFANFQTLEFIIRAGAEGMLAGPNDWVCMQQSGTLRQYPRGAGGTFSLFSWTEQCSGVCARGVKYPLEDAVLTRHFPLGVSNVITGDHAEIVCGEGLLLVMGSIE